MRTPEEVAAGRPRRGCLVNGLAVVGGLFLALLVAGVTGFVILTRPGAGPTGAATAPEPAASASVSSASAPADLAQGEAWLPAVDLRTEQLVADGRELRNVHVTGRGARIAPDGTLRAAHLEVDAVVPFDVVERQVGQGLKIASAPDGMVQVTLPVRVLGRGLDISAIARVSAEGDRIAITPVRVMGGPMLDGVLERLPAIRRPVPDLPPGMTVQRVNVVDGGFAVQATGDDVTVSR